MTEKVYLCGTTKISALQNCLKYDREFFGVVNSSGSEKHKE